ncbi:MAG: SWIM zinc finger family protein [Desulfohalobiaceae bacterium]|nr:SWIM zinc finger family protein [Desulfohalobiaceae bacterium]
MSGWGWGRYVPVAERRAKARKKMEKLRKQGHAINPVEISGRTIARSFWGKGWCDHLESFSDYANRLPRGRTYVRNGSVCHLEIDAGRIKAMVSGSRLYNVEINIKTLGPERWKRIKDKCSGGIGSILELLQGKLSDRVMEIVSNRENGLFPLPREITLNCDCPDWAVMCKHVAAVLYGIGNRLDSDPELLFLLRDQDPAELIASEVSVPSFDMTAAEETISDDDLSTIFGIELDDEPEAVQARKPSRPQKASAKKKPAEKSPGFVPNGKNIIRLREKTGLSAASFAAQIGVSAASVYRWEKSTGSLKLHSRTLAALMKMNENPGKK